MKDTFAELAAGEEDLIFEAAQLYVRFGRGNAADQVNAAKLVQALIQEDYEDKDLNRIANKVLNSMGQREGDLDKARRCFRVGKCLISDGKDRDELPF
jgi:hypothetical protein